MRRLWRLFSAPGESASCFVHLRLLQHFIHKIVTRNSHHENFRLRRGKEGTARMDRIEDKAKTKRRQRMSHSPLTSLRRGAFRAVQRLRHPGIAGKTRLQRLDDRLAHLRILFHAQLLQQQVAGAIAAQTLQRPHPMQAIGHPSACLLTNLCSRNRGGSIWANSVAILRKLRWPRNVPSKVQIRLGSRFTDRYFTGVRVKSLMVNPLTGSLREKRRTFRPLTRVTSTGCVLSHMPTVKGTAMSVGCVASLAATSRC